MIAANETNPDTAYNIEDLPGKIIMIEKTINDKRDTHYLARDIEDIYESYLNILKSNDEGDISVALMAINVEIEVMNQDGEVIRYNVIIETMNEIIDLCGIYNEIDFELITVKKGSILSGTDQIRLAMNRWIEITLQKMDDLGITNDCEFQGAYVLAMPICDLKKDSLILSEKFNY